MQERAEVKDGKRETCQRKDSSGRGFKFYGRKRRANPRVSIQYISTHLEIPATTVHRIIKKHLNIKSAFVRWIPHESMS